ncbi:MAG: hypothetical protein KDG52_02075 [Rhodocyclaceae bacterium]|nr:hypothetical protein [Rhodocyclaceae bacterium]
MLSLTDCLDFVDLDEATIEVIARHEELPIIVAAELGHQLLGDLRGIYRIHLMHRDLIEAAAESGHLDDEKRLRKSYQAFNRKYPVPRQLP